MKIRNGFVSNSSSSSFVVVTNIKSMCNQNIPSVNLQTAVLMQVQEFVNSGQTFSRYDITKALRQKCNDGLMEIPDVENVNGSPRFDIRKGAVDSIFEQLYQNCLANGIPPLRYDFNPVLGYRIFSVDQNALASLGSTTPAPTPAPAPAPVVTPTPAPVTPPVQMVSVPVATLTDSEIKRRVGLYLDRCRLVGFQPTLKQIQSAIKRGNRSTGLSYREIANVATSLGYKV